MENPILLVLYFAESLLMALLGRTILGFPSQQQIFRFAMFNAVAVYVVRSAWGIFELPLGLNTIVSFAISYSIYKFACKIKFSFATAIIGYVGIIANEILFFPQVLKMFNVTIAQFIESTTTHMYIGLIAEIPLLVFIVGGSYVIKLLVTKIIKGVKNDNRECC